MGNVKNILIIALGVVIVFLLTCNGDIKPPKTITKTTVRVDSLRVVDTLERVIYVPIAQAPIIDTFYVNDTISKFHYGKKDSLLTYNLYVYAEKAPQKIEIDYDIKQFTIYDSIYIRDSTHIENKAVKSFVSFGASVLGNSNSFGFAPTLVYNHRKGGSYSAGYDVINGMVHIGFTKKIAFK